MATTNAEETVDPLAALRIPRREEARRPSLFARLFQGVVGLAIVAALAGGSLFALQRSGMIGSDAEWIPDALRSKVEVRAVKVAVETGRAADAVVVATGYLMSYRQANIGARAAGRIESVNVEEGSRVNTGDVIAVLDHKDIEAALAAAQASLQRAIAELGEHEVEIARCKKELDRSLKLKSTDAVSELEHDQAYFAYQGAVARRNTLEAAVAQARARLQESEQFKENMIVRAPFSGTVISKDAEVGESILPGGMGEASGRGSVVTIADLDRLEVDCDVKEDFIGRVTPGLPAEVAVEAVPGRRYKARVRKVIPMGDRARATIKVRVEILDADAKLFPEMSATVYFLPEANNRTPETNQQRVFCDSSAIVSDAEGEFVWQIDAEDRLRKVSVTAGRQRDGRTEVLDGLEGGERIVVDPPADLQPGQLVKLRE